MDNVICYLNTDLDLISEADLTALGNAFDAAGALPLHVTQADDGRWHATIETNVQHGEPEANIAELLAIVAALAPPLRSVWEGCTLREFNIGYDCGAEPWAFNQGLSTALLARIADAGASLRITLYPEQSASGPCAGAK